MIQMHPSVCVYQSQCDLAQDMCFMGSWMLMVTAQVWGDRMAMSVGHLNQGLENGTAHDQQVHAVPGPTFSLEEESRSSAKWNFMEIH